MFKRDISELNTASLIMKIDSIFLFFDDRLLLEHEEEVFNIDLRLINLSEEGAHIKERPGKLHEKSLNHYEISWSKPSGGDIPGSQQQVDG